MPSTMNSWNYIFISCDMRGENHCVSQSYLAANLAMPETAKVNFAI